jgi:DHA1 family bicyclomycin/chloramphenicol resistance-like MFS transporter
LTRFAKNALVLGLLSAVGPFAIDMYLPALPMLARDLGTSPATAQQTLTAFFVAFGVCQLIYGPWSDAAGRKRPLFFGIALFALASVGCFFAHHIGALLAFRALEGVGAASAAVIPRAIIRDLHTGHEATRLMSLVMLVFSVSPILAPLVGSAIIVPFGWRAVFAAVALLSILAMVLLATTLPETRPPEERTSSSPLATLRDFGTVFVDARFIGLTLTGAFGMASFFVFLAGSPFLYITHFGLTSIEYSLGFSVNAIGFIGTSQFAANLGRRFGIVRTIIVASVLFAISACVLAGLVFMGAGSLPLLIVMFFITFAFLGLVVPTTMVLALESYGRIAGIAAALGGTLQMIVGGLIIALTGVVMNGTPWPIVMMIAGCAIAALVACLATLVLGARADQTAPSSA